MGDSPPKLMVVDLGRFSNLISKMLSIFFTYTSTNGIQAIRLLQNTAPELVFAERSIPSDNLIPDYHPSVLKYFSPGDRGVTILEEAANEELESADGFLAALTTS